MQLNDPRLKEDSRGYYVLYEQRARGRQGKYYGEVYQCSVCKKKYFSCIKKRKRNIVICESCARRGKNNGQYTTGEYVGKECYSNHRKIWIEHNGEIPEGYCIHHINENKKDNRIENLQCLTYKEHIRLHAKDRKVWNKGLTRKNKKWREIQDKALFTRKKNYLKYCKTIYDYKNKHGKSYVSLVPIFNRTKEQISYSYRKYETYLKNMGEKIYNEKTKCKECGEERTIFRNVFCRKCYERQNPKSKYYKKM